MGVARASDPPPNLSHSDRGPAFVGISWALTLLATIFLCLRLYCKYYTRRRLWWDDWILIGAWVMIIVNDALTTVLVVETKLGRHGWDLQITDPTRFTLLLSSRATVTLTAVSWTKIAFAVRLVRLTEGHVYRFVWFVIVSVNLAMGFSAAVPWIQCQPLAKSWNPTIPGTCWAAGVGTKIWIALGAYSAAMDFTLAALPWTFLRNLRIRKKEKIGIAVAMSMGVVAGTVAVVKCFKLPNLNSPDPYNSTELFIWDIAESTTTMMAACIPSLRVLIRDARKGSTQLRSNNLLSFSTELANLQSKKTSQSIGVKESA